jgi:hypothetical protein
MGSNFQEKLRLTADDWKRYEKAQTNAADQMIRHTQQQVGGY